MRSKNRPANESSAILSLELASETRCSNFKPASSCSRSTNAKIVPVALLSMPMKSSRAVAISIEEVAVARAAIPGTEEIVMRSPFAMTPFSAFTLSGTRPESATGLNVVSSDNPVVSPRSTPGLVEMIPSTAPRPCVARATETSRDSLMELGASSLYRVLNFTRSRSRFAISSSINSGASMTTSPASIEVSETG